MTAKNLKQAQIEGRKSHRSRKEEKDANKTGKKLQVAVSRVGKTRDDLTTPKISDPNPGLGPVSGALLVTHGKTQTVSTSDLLGSRVEEVRGRGVGGRGRGRGGKDIPQKKLKQQRQRKATITESEDDEEDRPGWGVGGLQRPSADVTGSELVGAEVTEDSEGLVMRLDKRFCHSDSHSSLVSYQYTPTLLYCRLSTAGFFCDIAISNA